MLGVNVPAPQLLQLLHLQVFLIILLIELIDGCSELSLVGQKLLPKILGNDDSISLLDPLISLKLTNSLFSTAAQHIRHPVLRIVYLSHHQSAIVLPNLGIQLLGMSQQNVTIKRPHLFNTTVGLVRHPHVQLHPQNV